MKNNKIDIKFNSTIACAAGGALLGSFFGFIGSVIGALIGMIIGFKI